MPRLPDPEKMSPESPWVVLPSGLLVSKYDSRGNTNVVLNDQFTPSLDFSFIQAKGVFTTVAVQVAIDDMDIEVANATGISIGDYLGVFCPVAARFYFGTVLGIAVNVLTMDTPFDFAYLVGDNVVNFTRDMNVNGNVTPQTFVISGAGPTADVAIDIYNIRINIVDNSAMDDTKFGSRAALSKGLVLRVNNGITTNMFNVKTNGEIATLAATSNYPEKVPAGVFVFRARYAVAGWDGHGVSVRLNPGDTLEAIIQDDLSDQDVFRMIAQGHIVD